MEQTSIQPARADPNPHDSLPEWSKGVDSSSTSASCVGSDPSAVIWNMLEARGRSHIWRNSPTAFVIHFYLNSLRFSLLLGGLIHRASIAQWQNVNPVN